MADEVWTIGKLLQWTADYLKKQGSTSARLDAEVLLAHCRKSPRIALYTAFEEVASDPLRTQFRELVKQRAAGKPVAYLVGEREFYSLKFKVTPDVLIPRPETEFLVIRALDLLKERAADSSKSSEPAKIADVGTGSGIIAVTVAKHSPKTTITAVDISPAALEIAKQNAAHHKVDDRITFVEGDLLSGFKSEPQWDFVLSNPPYVTEAEYADLDKTVRDFEPRGALVSGPAGTELIAKLLDQAAAQLVPGGWFLCELSPMIEPAVCEMISKQGSFELHPSIKDLAQHPRIVQARKK